MRAVLAATQEPLTLGTSRVEIACAIARWERSNEIAGTVASVYRREARTMLESYIHVWPSTPIVEMAWDLSRLHPLRAGDALHLATWKVLVAGYPASLPFVCLDQRLRDAALAEGATILP